MTYCATQQEERTLYGCIMCTGVSHTQKNNLIIHMKTKHGLVRNATNVEYKVLTKSNDEIINSKPKAMPGDADALHKFNSNQLINLVKEGKLRVDDCQGPKDPELLRCPDCPREGPFQSPNTLISHRQTKHPDLPCLQCGIDGCSRERARYSEPNLLCQNICNKTDSCVA